MGGALDRAGPDGLGLDGLGLDGLGLDGAALAALTDLRRALHAAPDLSGAEENTAARIAAELKGTGAQIVAGLGGAGLAAVFDSGQPGPSVMVRAELDALPIHETGSAPWASRRAGWGHLCGHDGHMTILVGLARVLAHRGPERGRVVLLFQPAEETGAGARAVLADPRFAGLACDWAFALHNLPGVPLGRAWLRAGPVNCASSGLVLRLTGKTSHASAPEAGVSPAAALARLIPALQALGPGGPMGPDYRLATLTHARLGLRALGIAPGDAEILLTLRALGDDGLAAMQTAALALARAEAAAEGLALDWHLEEPFAACVNDAQAVAHLARALEACAIPHEPGDLPMRASEDFGLFATVSRAAMVFLGAGRAHPMLHNPDYDFPDALIAPGVALFHRVVRGVCGG